MKIENLYQYYLKSSGVCTDTRKIEAGCLFFALKGEKFNGNIFAAKALSAGAQLAIIDEAAQITDDRFILVENVLETLQKLANHHRKQLKIPIIGINGSNGKTTSKELFKAVLSEKYKTFATVGNLNNHIGVPLTLLSIHNDIELAIIELGANHQGEIKELLDICEPSHIYLTNIGRSHLEGFGGLEGVKKGEGESYDYFSKTKGPVFINTKDNTLVEMARDRNLSNLIGFPNENDFFKCEFLSANPYVKYKDGQGEIIETPGL